MNLQRLMLMRSAARVRRMHVVSTHHGQTVGEHTFGVLAVLLEVADDVPYPLVRAVLYHDAPEAMTGDVPAPTKARNPNLKSALDEAEAVIMRDHDMEVPLSLHEKTLLAYCDLMELALYASEEIDMGNNAMAGVLRNCIGIIEKKNLALVTSKALELFDFVRRRSSGYHPQLGETRLAGWTG